jgi:hypothetical protein
MSAPKYRAICLTCYTCELTPPVSKRAAERAATSHLGAYGHNVTIQQVSPFARTPADRERAARIRARLRTLY